MSSHADLQLMPHARETEEDRVTRWRHEQFCALGFTPHEALRLAVSRADLHEARALIAAGCTLQLAFKILL